MNDDVMETLKTIQWLYANTIINDDECALLKDLAFWGDPKDIAAVMKQMNEVTWLRACDRLTPEELAGILPAGGGPLLVFKRAVRL